MSRADRIHALFLSATRRFIALGEHAAELRNQGAEAGPAITRTHTHTRLQILSRRILRLAHAELAALQQEAA